MVCFVEFIFKGNLELISHNVHQFGVQTFQLQENEADSKQRVQTLNFCNILFNVNYQRF